MWNLRYWKGRSISWCAVYTLMLCLTLYMSVFAVVWIGEVVNFGIVLTADTVRIISVSDLHSTITLEPTWLKRFKRVCVWFVVIVIGPLVFLVTWFVLFLLRATRWFVFFLFGEILGGWSLTQIATEWVRYGVYVVHFLCGSTENYTHERECVFKRYFVHIENGE